MKTGAYMMSAAVAVGFAFAPVTSPSANMFDQLLAESQQEMARLNGTLRMALDWPAPDTVKVFEQLSKDLPHIKSITYSRNTGVPPTQRYYIALQQGQVPPYEILNVASEFEAQFIRSGFFVKPKYAWSDLAKALPADWPTLNPDIIDSDGYFIATAAQMRGNAWNVREVSEAEAPKTFADCADPKWGNRNIIDGRSKVQALLHDPVTRESTINTIRTMRENGLVAVNGQANVLTRVVSGEFAITCFINFHTTQRMIDRGETALGFALGDVVPVELATRFYVPSWTQTPATVQLIAMWFATKGQSAIDGSYRGFPWVEGTRLYEAAKGKHFAICGADCVAKYEEYNRLYADLLGIPYVQ